MIENFMIKIQNMRFLNADELYVKKSQIREEFKKLTYDEKEMYKWYFYYQLCLLKNPLKETFWDYIVKENNKKSYKKLNEYYIEYCEKRDKAFKSC